jgi:hypothetical protein
VPNACDILRFLSWASPAVSTWSEACTCKY